MNPTQIAYAAGLYEGEGNIHTRKDTSTITTTIRMTDREPLDRMVEATGLGKVRGPHKSTGPVPGREYTPIYSWNLYGMEKSQAFIAMVWPYLGPRRRAQAKEALSRGRWDGSVATRVKPGQKLPPRGPDKKPRKRRAPIVRNPL